MTQERIKVDMKLVEELNELSAVIMQQSNKLHKNYTIEIQNEIADVQVWLTEYASYFDENYISNRIIEKYKKYKL